MVEWARLIYEAFGMKHPRLFIVLSGMIGCLLFSGVAWLINYGQQAQRHERERLVAPRPVQQDTEAQQSKLMIQLKADTAHSKPVRIVYRQHGGLHPNFAHAPTLTVYIWNTGSTHLRIVRLKIAAPSVAKDRMIETDLVASPHSALPSEQDVTLPVFVYQPEGLVDSAPRRFRWTKAYLFASVQ